MNPDFPQNERAKLEAKLTSLLLGELHADEVAALSKAMEQDPELAALYERLKVTIEFVREGAAQPKAEEQASRKLSAERREKLLASFKTVTPKEFAKPRRAMDWLVPLAACVAIAGVIAVMLLPALNGAKRKAMVGRSQTDRLSSMELQKRHSGDYENLEAGGGHGRKAPDVLTVAPASGNQFGIAPAETPAAASAPIVLPSKREGDAEPGQNAFVMSQNSWAAEAPKKADDHRLFFGEGNINRGAVVTAGVTVTNGIAPGAMTFNTERNDNQSSYRALSQLGTEDQSGKLALAAGSETTEQMKRVVENLDKVGNEPELAKQFARAQSRQSGFTLEESYDRVVSNALPGVGADANSTVLFSLSSTTVSGYVDTNAQWNFGTPAYSFGGAARDTVPAPGDLPALGRAFGKDSTLADNEDFKMALTRDDVNGLRYAATNGVVLADSAELPKLIGANSFGNGATVNGGTLTLGETVTGSSESVLRQGYIAPPSASDGLLTSGLRAPSRESEVVLPTVVDSWQGGGGGSGGGGGGGRSELKTASVKVDPNTFFSGLQNVGTIDFGNVTNTSSEASRGPSLAGVDVPASGNGRGLRYISGLEPASETQLGVSNFLQATGVNLDPSTGKSVFLNDRQNTLTVRGTEEDLELVQQAINTLNVAPPEVALKTKFAEVNSNDSRRLGFDWYLGNKMQLGTDVMASAGTPPATAPTKSDNEDRIQTSQLTQDGKLLYQMGKVDEAETKMNEALNRDPSNQSALYYLNLIKQVRVRQVVDARNVTSMDRMVQVEKGWVDNDARRGLPVAQTARPNSDTNWWNAAPTGRAFYDDSLNSSVAMKNRIAEYASAKEELDIAKKLRVALEMKSAQETMDVNLPRGRVVAVMNSAIPAATEKPGLGQKIKEAFSGKVERTARVQVAADRPDISTFGPPSMDTGYDPYFLQTEFEAIQSDSVLSRVVEKLNLDGGDKSKRQTAEAQLKKNLDVRSVKNTKVIEIGVSNEKPEEAARLANAVAEAYRDYRSEEYEDLKTHGIKGLHEQMVEQDKKIQVAQAKVDGLRARLDMPDSAAANSSATELVTGNRLSELSSLKVQKEAEYNQQKTLLEKLKGMDKVALRRALPIAYPDTQLNGLLSEHDFALQNLIKLKLDYNPDHPKFKSAQALVDELDKKIDDRVQGVVLGLDAKVAYEKAYLEVLQNDLAVAEKAQTNTNDVMEAFARAKDSALPKPAVLPPTPQPEILTRENAVSTFSLNVSDVSFKLAAASLEKGQMPEPAVIRSEEFINAFDYRDPEAAPGVPIAFAAERARYPFAHNRELLRFSLKTAAAGRQAGRPLNIVLLLDNSGSMERADRVGIIREALRVLAKQLQASDTFSIVTFARTAQLRVDGVPGSQAAAAAEEIAKLTPEGGTNLGEALDLAYETARHHYLANGDNRVVLLTDGAANLGDVDAEVLKQKVEAHRQQGVALDCFGIGWEGYNDDLLETLTRNGDGRYGFINTPEAASTDFVAQIAGALHVAAADVKVQVEFNPKRVTSYRQIGYVKHQLTKEQFRDNTVDAAEIAAQEAGNALYTIEINPEGQGSIATVRVRYKVPGTPEYREQAWDVPYTGGAVAMDQASPAMRLASTACGFSEWLATSPFASEVSPEELLKYLNGVPQVYGADARPAKLEWMIRQARSISGK